MRRLAGAVERSGNFCGRSCNPGISGYKLLQVKSKDDKDGYGSTSYWDSHKLNAKRGPNPGHLALAKLEDEGCLVP